jgi:hypothetical protein
MPPAVQLTPGYGFPQTDPFGAAGQMRNRTLSQMNQPMITQEDIDRLAREKLSLQFRNVPGGPPGALPPPAQQAIPWGEGGINPARIGRLEAPYNRESGTRPFSGRNILTQLAQGAGFLPQQTSRAQLQAQSAKDAAEIERMNEEATDGWLALKKERHRQFEVESNLPFGNLQSFGAAQSSLATAESSRAKLSGELEAQDAAAAKSAADMEYLELEIRELQAKLNTPISEEERFRVVSQLVYTDHKRAQKAVTDLIEQYNGAPPETWDPAAQMEYARLKDEEFNLLKQMAEILDPAGLDPSGRPTAIFRRHFEEESAAYEAEKAAAEAAAEEAAMTADQVAQESLKQQRATPNPNLKRLGFFGGLGAMTGISGLMPPKPTMGPEFRPPSAIGGAPPAAPGVGPAVDVGALTPPPRPGLPEVPFESVAPPPAPTDRPKSAGGGGRLTKSQARARWTQNKGSDAGFDGWWKSKTGGQ